MITWLLFYFVSVRPHILPENGVKLEEKSVHETYYDLYVPDEELEYSNKGVSSYNFYAPKFLSFSSYITHGSAVNYNSESDTYNNPTGSSFDYEMTASINLFGKIKSYRFNITPYVNGELKYDNRCTIIVNKNADLINEKKLSSDAINIYNVTRQEIQDIIDTFDHIYHF